MKCFSLYGVPFCFLDQRAWFWSHLPTTHMPIISLRMLGRLHAPHFERLSHISVLIYDITPVTYCLLCTLNCICSNKNLKLVHTLKLSWAPSSQFKLSVTFSLSVILGPSKYNGELQASSTQSLFKETFPLGSGVRRHRLVTSHSK